MRENRGKITVNKVGTMISSHQETPNKQEVKRENWRFWSEFSLKSFTAAGGIIVIALSFYQFNQTKKQENVSYELEVKALKLDADARRLESKRVFLESQFKLYLEAVDVSSQLATIKCRQNDATCIGSYLNACQKFLQLYWGKLGIVEDLKVERAMVGFHRAFQRQHKHMCDPEFIDVVAGMSKILKSNDDPTIARAALNLARCVNASLAESWGIELGKNLCEEGFDQSWFERAFDGEYNK